MCKKNLKLCCMKSLNIQTLIFSCLFAAAFPSSLPFALGTSSSLFALLSFNSLPCQSLLLTPLTPHSSAPRPGGRRRAVVCAPGAYAHPARPRFAATRNPRSPLRDLMSRIRPADPPCPARKPQRRAGACALVAGGGGDVAGRDPAGAGRPPAPPVSLSLSPSLSLSLSLSLFLPLSPPPSSLLYLSIYLSLSLSLSLSLPPSVAPSLRLPSPFPSYLQTCSSPFLPSSLSPLLPFSLPSSLSFSSSFTLYLSLFIALPPLMHDCVCQPAARP